MVRGERPAKGVLEGPEDVLAAFVDAVLGGIEVIGVKQVIHAAAVKAST